MTDPRPGPDERAPGPAGAIVAAFDFDGTLTRRDSLLPFLVSVRGPAATARALVAESRRFARVLVGRSSRDAAKEALLTRLLAGVDAGTLSASGHAFAERLIARRVRPAMRRRLEWHLRSGHQVVIVSASPAIYVEPAGRRLGVDAVLATELEVGPDSRLTGRISGLNCRGEEKALRLRAWLQGRPPDGAGSGRTGSDTTGQAHGVGAGRDALGPDDGPGRLWAYGDSRGDVEMLAQADVAVWVGWRSLISPPRQTAPGSPGAASASP